MEFLCTVPLLASLLSACVAPQPRSVGYVEGEYVFLAPLETANVLAIEVARGDTVREGDLVARLETRDAEIAVARASAELAAAESRLADLQQGSRPEEIRMVEASLASARAELTEAERELARQRDLFERGVQSRAQLDAAETKVSVARARVAQLEANLAVVRLPARPDQIKAAEATVTQAKAVLRDRLWRLEKRRIVAPVSGEVADIIRFRGELAGPQAPVISILPDNGIKLKLYVNENMRPRYAIGTRLDVRCDGCPAGQTALVSYISDSPEFTPPVIYSLEARQKLVFLIEARPEGDAPYLKPGQIVDASVPDAAR